MAQDDYYYEIQLTNKQLVFYFVAGAAGLILSFLAGIMVGRGVDSSGGEVQAAKPVREDRIVAEEPARPSPTPAQDLNYAQRLESDKTDDDLASKTPSGRAESAKGSPARAGARGKASPSPSPKAEARETQVADASPPPPTAPAPSLAPAKASPGAPRPSPSPKPPVRAEPAAGAPAGGTFTIQVGAFKDRASAESVVTHLKSKGFAAFVTTPEGSEGGLFNVRVGTYAARADAQRAEKKLKDEEKFQPFIVHNP